MRILKNEVTLDTCGCKFQQSKDRDDPTARMSFDHFIQKCPAHAQMTDPDAWSAVWLDPSSEQHRKNGLYKALTVDDPIGLGAGLVEPIVSQKQVRSEFFNRTVGEFDANGNAVMQTRYELIGGTTCYIWKFDDQRCLCLCFDGCWLDAPTKQRLQDYCNGTYGTDVVRVMNANEEP